MADSSETSAARIRQDFAYAAAMQRSDGVAGIVKECIFSAIEDAQAQQSDGKVLQNIDAVISSLVAIRQNVVQEAKSRVESSAQLVDADSANFDNEVGAIAAYIGQKWSPISNLTSLVQDVRVAAERAARVFFEDNPVWEVAIAAQEARVSMLTRKYGDKQGTLRYYDAGWKLLDSVKSGLQDTRAAALQMDGAWDYSRRVRSLLAVMKAKYPDLDGARPHGWAELEAGYTDFDGQEEYDSSVDYAMFKGALVSSAGAGDFVSRTALPYVMYDEKCQGRVAHYVLVGAIFSHFMVLAEKRNTQSVCDDLRALVDSLPLEHVFDVALNLRTPILKVLVGLGGPFATREEFAQAQANVAAYNALSPEGKAAKDQEQKESMEAFLTNMASPSSRLSDDAIQVDMEMRISSALSALKDALGEGSSASPSM